MEDVVKKENAKKVRSGKIELMRFICAVTVAGYHAGCSVDHPFELFHTAFMSVEFFFIVSGFLLASSLKKYKAETNEELLKINAICSKKRLMSFLPCFVTTIFFTSIAWIPYFGLTYTEWVEKMLGAIPNFLLLQVFGFKGADWFVPTWYLSVLMLSGYILTPIILKYKRTYGLYIAPFVSAVFLGAVIRHWPSFDVNCSAWKGIVNFGFLRGFADMSLGCTCYYITESGYLKRLKKKTVTSIGIISTLLLIITLIFGSGHNAQILSLCCCIISVPILFWDDSFSSVFNTKFVYYSGKLSLPIFLCHSITRYWVIGSLPDESYAAQLLWFYLYTLALAVIFERITSALKFSQ